MNIKILDSWLREYLITKASAKEISEKLSLTSLSVEKVDKYAKDYLYEMEITTNRPDLFSVLGIGREASAILPQFGIDSEFIPLKLEKRSSGNSASFPIEIKNDPKLVNRVCAVVMEVKTEKSSNIIRERLETSGIRSLNNVIDVTNYVMRTIGHPAHVFDLDRLNTKKLSIREGRKGEKITTLDNKTHILQGGEIVAADETNRIVDLLGIMGLLNSVVTEGTKKILYFIDNNKKGVIRNASMALGIRTEAAALNEKGVDPNLAMDALLYGIELFEKNASGKQVSEILDIYPNKPKEKTISVEIKKINTIIGVDIDEKKSEIALKALGFKTTLGKNSLKVSVPSFRANDIEEEEDVIEEVARIYGYHNLPGKLPKPQDEGVFHPYVDQFYFEARVKNAMKYWGFIETYTYSFVSEDMYDGPVGEAVEVANPLTKDFVYMRNSLIPSLLKVVSENKKYDDIKIFEIANVYTKKADNLPNEKLMFSAVVKKENASFYEMKGLIEQIIKDLGIENLFFKKSSKSSLGASLYIQKDYLGEIEVLDTNLVDFELDFSIILEYANVKKVYKPFAKYPPVVEDLSVTISSQISTEEIIKKIEAQSEKVVDVSLKDSYENTRTFHIIYQDLQKNMTKEEVLGIRDKIISSLKESFSAEI